MAGRVLVFASIACLLAILRPSVARTVNDDPTVDVVLYGEALCPYTLGAINDIIGPLFDTVLADKFSFRYVAYGNARRSALGGLVCQHGTPECRLNRVLNCAQALATSQAQRVAFIRCLSEKKPWLMEREASSCATGVGLDFGELDECATGEQGKELEQAAGDETGALHPPHTYVPWLVVNGVPLGEADTHLAKFICVALQGAKPEACFVPPEAARGLVTHKPAVLEGHEEGVSKE